jgi:hypothetical protein
MRSKDVDVSEEDVEEGRQQKKSMMSMLLLMEVSENHP